MAKAAGAKAVLFHPSFYNIFYDLNDLKEGKPDIVTTNINELKKLF